MVVLHNTRLLLIVTDRVGYDPMRASGLVMVHLQHMAKQRNGKARIYKLQAGPLRPVIAWQMINRIANRRNIGLDTLIVGEIQRITGR